MGCPPRVKEALATLPGVTKVEVDAVAKTATCYIEGEEFDNEVAIQALADADFKNSSVIP